MATASDPTISSLERINERDYVLVRSAPIFIPHERSFPDGEKVVVTRDDLATIAEGINRRYAESGVLVRVTDGHIDPELPEHKQPPLLGFASNAKVGTFGPSHQPAVLADLWIRREYESLLSQRPYRSSEYYPRKKEIRGVALLLRDPHLDMGIIHYSRGITFTYRPFFEVSRMASKLKNYSGDGAPPGDEPEKKDDAGGAGAPGADLTPEEANTAMRYMRHYLKDGGEPSNWSKKYGMGAPAGNSTSVPDMPGGGGGPPAPGDPLMPNSRRENAVIYSMQQKIEALEREKKLEHVERVLDSLEHVEHYEFDRAAETAQMMAMTEEQIANRAAQIRRYHSQSAGGSPIVVYRGPVEGGPETSMSASQMEHALTYQAEHHCTWAAAMHHVKKLGR